MDGMDVFPSPIQSKAMYGAGGDTGVWQRALSKKANVSLSRRRGGGGPRAPRARAIMHMRVHMNCVRVSGHRIGSSDSFLLRPSLYRSIYLKSE